MKWIHKKPTSKIFYIKAVITTLIVVLSMFFFMGRYRIGIDPQINRCIPEYTVYLIDLKNQRLEKKGFYAFYAKKLQPFFQDGTWMVKRLTAMPGDRVEIDKSAVITVNKKIVGKGLPLLEKLHMPQNALIGSAVLKNGHYWFMGESLLSFDSRYWGAVKDDQIIGRAYPLF